ncbi:SAC3/GANP/Nin1/mts3/eIF-3 p25 family-domain-containing protein [Lasiosphaeria hispida]|uniref:SAC3/GANP/Nin1/mts3/eIF-3 p25 family-domain-containing protein n=1 Tax=Lasiosphaeria hispida TaxID=260671 RepID=A0AAJ0HRB8_9PEZI|nr:SAC3/GANP/Nin1/mts3/eIF-3 p25 family-domain-containing protein [Lasiosphaeria hispida]
MAAPANNPFGAPPQAIANPSGVATSASGQPASAFGAPPKPATGTPAFAGFGSLPSTAGNSFSSFKAPPNQAPTFGAFSGSATSTHQLSPAVQNPFGNPPAHSNPFATGLSTNGSAQRPLPFGSQAQLGSTQLNVSNADEMARRKKSKSPLSKNGNASGFGKQGQRNDSEGPRNSPFEAGGPRSTSTRQDNGPNGFHNQAKEPVKKIQPGQRNRSDRTDMSKERSQPRVVKNRAQNGPTREPGERTKQLSPFAFNFANKLYAQLQKDGIKPPQWLPDLGDPNKRGAVETLKEAYKKYRLRVYDSLRKAELIDDPEKRRRLEDALPFKGICEDMCPEFEQVSRVAEYDVKYEEKVTQSDGLNAWPDPSKMVKKFGRSAAGQDAPLPMDVRSVAALRRTTDYLFNDLLQSDDNLPSMHNYLWDRTRAVRKDFTFHSQKSPEEMKDMVYCFETITRFHATALHLLSRKGYANDDFDYKQEIEQLGRTILSLMEAYDACRDKHVHCENEPEFRSYYLLLNAHDPSIGTRIPAWGKEFWFESEEIQTALSLIQAMEDVREPKGPIKPRRMTTLSDTAFANYFAIVEDSRVSYTMACIAEVHFTSVRQNILKNLVKGYARYRDAPRTISAPDLNKILRFDTTEEAVEFMGLHGFEFSTWVPDGKPAPPAPYLLLNSKKKYVPSPRVRQSYSGQLVERKRKSQLLAHLIYNTVYEEAGEQQKPKAVDDGSDSLFVSQSTDFQESSPSSASSLNLTPSDSPSLPFGFPARDATASNGTVVDLKPLEAPKPSSFSFPNVQSSPVSQPGISGGSNAFSTFGQGVPHAQATNSPLSASGQPSSGFSQPLSTSTTQGALPSSNASTPRPPVFGQSLQSPQGTAAPSSSHTQKPAETPSFFSSLSKDPGTTQASAPPQTPQTPAFFSSTSATEINGTPKPSSISLAQAQGTSIPKTTSLGSFGPSSSPSGSSILVSSPGSTTLSSAATTPAKPAPPSIAFSSTPTSAQSAPSVIPPVSATGPTPQQQQALPTASGSFKFQSTPSSATTQLDSAPSSSTSRTPPPPDLGQRSSTSSQLLPPLPVQQPPPTKDLMGGLTNWFVMGDQGLMEQFTEFSIQNLVAQAFEQFQQEESERKRKEEDDLSWQEARKFRQYSLGVKFFYRWQENVRALATQRILREGKEKMRRYREAERVKQQKAKEEAEKAEREARRVARRKLEADGQQLAILASSQRRSSTEDQLLASGIFSGLRDEFGAARRVVREVNGIPWGGASRSQRYAESDLELEPRRLSISAREPAQTPDSTMSKPEGWKTRSLREKFGIEPRRSVSASSSINGTSSRPRQSLPAAPRTTNFTRKRSAGGSGNDHDYDDREAKRKPTTSKTNAFKSQHWDMRARGFVPMPDGKWLPESIANAMRAGKRFDGLGDCGLGPGKEDRAGGQDGLLGVAAVDTDDELSSSKLQLRLVKLRNRPFQSHGHGHSKSVNHSNAGYMFESRSGSESYFESPPPPPLWDDAGVTASKRKRAMEEDEEFVPGTGESSPSAAKKTHVRKEETSAMVQNVQDMLRELRETMDRLDEDRPFAREQSAI